MNQNQNISTEVPRTINQLICVNHQKTKQEIVKGRVDPRYFGVRANIFRGTKKIIFKHSLGRCLRFYKKKIPHRGIKSNFQNIKTKRLSILPFSKTLLLIKKNFRSTKPPHRECISNEFFRSMFRPWSRSKWEYYRVVVVVYGFTIFSNFIFKIQNQFHEVEPSKKNDCKQEIWSFQLKFHSNRPSLNRIAFYLYKK